jgi:hypothetical protein
VIVEIGPYNNGEAERVENIQIANYDTWNMDYTLGLIAYPMLLQLRETKHGSPHVDLEDVPAELRMSYEGWPSAPLQYDFFYDDVEKLQEELMHKRWEWVLNEMIFAFENKINDDDWESQFHSGESDIVWKPINYVDSDGEKYYEMTLGPNDTHVFDHEGYSAYQDRISNGFRLFGKYYEALWD